ncbi:hypothetical protein DACRYDRAFT_25570 [Dacryopinax primogenitus]|uniref:Uncharacterized protein n=1 Tax=Dacryopinax primogenitus (strain DJM 731) TaxID=1858805 RepID=M5FPX0_DACPD|nr:uncharacterized protein DACRYDRAFT_25570 [Dacryopinax primogenitus]EJT96619.1 hypothetical protein DACRYDRAFT_25570 [Dacryopinax primogenitus]
MVFFGELDVSDARPIASDSCCNSNHVLPTTSTRFTDPQCSQPCFCARGQRERSSDVWKWSEWVRRRQSL